MHRSRFALALVLVGPSALARPSDVISISAGGGTAHGDAGQAFVVIGQPLVGLITNGPVVIDLGFIPCIASCPADFDGDGFVSGADFDLYVQGFESGDMSADFDSDGFITGLDFDLFVQAFEAGC